jgi:hypothetical protein
MLSVALCRAAFISEGEEAGNSFLTAFRYVWRFFSALSSPHLQPRHEVQFTTSVIYDAQANPTCADYAKVKTHRRKNKTIISAFIVTVAHFTAEFSIFHVYTNGV